MELRDIEYFAVIAKHGNVTRAAEALELTPTALSKSLRRLEKSVDAKVVTRTPKGVELTSVGHALLAQVQRLRLTLADVAREAADLGKGRAGHLRIGAGPTVCENLPRVFAALRKEAPNVTAKITVTDNDEMVPLLQSGELDLVYNDCSKTYDGIVMEDLYNDEWVVCASRNHRLAKLKRVTIADLARERWAINAPNLTPQAVLSGAFSKLGLSAPRVALETRSVHLRLRTWAASDLLGFMSRHIIREYAPLFALKELPVKELVWRRRIVVLYRKDAYLSPAAKRFIEVLKATAKEIAAEK